MNCIEKCQKGEEKDNYVVNNHLRQWIMFWSNHRTNLGILKTIFFDLWIVSWITNCEWFVVLSKWDQSYAQFHFACHTRLFGFWCRQNHFLVIFSSNNFLLSLLETFSILTSIDVTIGTHKIVLYTINNNISL